MTPDDFVQDRKGNWERLTYLLQRAERGQLGALSENELVEMGQLYRALTSDLAVAQRDWPNHTVTRYLNQLVGRAHPLIYRGEPLVWRHIVEFYGHTLPQLYRDSFAFVAAAVLLFLGVGGVVFLIISTHPDAADYVLSSQAIRLIKDGTPWWQDLNRYNQIGASVIMTNNLQVAFYAFAGGMLAGLFTVYVLVSNGIQLGAVIGLMQANGRAGLLIEFIIGHGVLEISEILMAGASGLMLGYAIVHPGLLSRKDALTLAAQKSIRLLLGTAPLLVVAGLIEGFLSPSGAPVWLKYAVGLGSGVLLYAYLLTAGRRRPERPGALQRRLRFSFAALSGWIGKSRRASSNPIRPPSR